MLNQHLLDYIMRCGPALVVVVLFLMLVPRALSEVRLLGYILVFFVLRDAMTPLGLWRIGDDGWFWLRVVDDPTLFILVGASCVAIVVAMLRVDVGLASVMVWRKGGWINVIASGLVGVGIVVAPIALFPLGVPLDSRGGPVRTGLLPVLLLFCLLVNLYEETLFRGFLQGLVEKHTSPLRAAVASGVAFGLGHASLATAVTGLGAPLLAFVTWEGVVAGLVRARAGVFASTLTHGIAIFMVASGIV